MLSGGSARIRLVRRSPSVCFPEQPMRLTSPCRCGINYGSDAMKDGIGTEHNRTAKPGVCGRKILQCLESR